MKCHCHLCGKVTAEIRDASIAKGTAFVCPVCAGLLPSPQPDKRGDMTDSMPKFMSDFFRGFKK